MTKLIFAVAMLLSTTMLLSAQEWVSVERNASTRIQETLVSSSEEEIVIDVKVG